MFLPIPPIVHKNFIICSRVETKTAEMVVSANRIMANSSDTAAECNSAESFEGLNITNMCDRELIDVLIMTLMYLFIVIIGLISNGSVILASIFERWKEIDQFTFVMAVSQAFCHFLFALLIYPMGLVSVLQKKGWTLGSSWRASCSQNLARFCSIIVPRFSSGSCQDFGLEFGKYVAIFIFIPVACSVTQYVFLLYRSNKKNSNANDPGKGNKNRSFWMNYRTSFIMIFLYAISQFPRWIYIFLTIAIATNEISLKPDYRVADFIVVWSSFGSILIPFGYLVTCPTYFNQEFGKYVAIFIFIPVACSVTQYVFLLYRSNKKNSNANDPPFPLFLSSKRMNYRTSFIMIFLYAISQFPRWIYIFLTIAIATNEISLKPDYRVADFIVVWSSFGSILIPFGYLVTCPTYFNQVTQFTWMAWLKRFEPYLYPTKDQKKCERLESSPSDLTPIAGSSREESPVTQFTWMAWLKRFEPYLYPTKDQKKCERLESSPSDLTPIAGSSREESPSPGIYRVLLGQLYIWNCTCITVCTY
eukprot:sb/3463765/